MSGLHPRPYRTPNGSPIIIIGMHLQHHHLPHQTAIHIVISTMMLSIVLFSHFPGVIKGQKVSMLSRGQTSIVDVGQSIQLDCEFHSPSFDLFHNPTVWIKDQFDEATRVNMMGNLYEPFVSAHRFKSTFYRRPPRYYFGLFIEDIRLEDNGNYTCEISGPDNIVLSQITHFIYVRVALDRVMITLYNNFPASDDQQSRHLVDRIVCTQNLPCPLSCVAFGGNPPPEVDLFLGDGRSPLDESTGFQLSHTVALLSGMIGLRTFHFRSERRQRAIDSEGDFQVDWTMDGSELLCVASVAGLANFNSKATLTVRHSPVITCGNATAYIGQRNVVVSCLIQSQPPVSELHRVQWFVNGTQLNETTSHLIDGNVYHDLYSTTLNLTSSSSIVEVCLRIAEIHPFSFNIYSLVVDNGIGKVAGVSVDLLEVEQTTNFTTTVSKQESRQNKFSSKDGRRRHSSDAFSSVADFGSVTSINGILILQQCVYLILINTFIILQT